MSKKNNFSKIYLKIAEAIEKLFCKTFGFFWGILLWAGTIGFYAGMVFTIGVLIYLTNLGEDLEVDTGIASLANYTPPVMTRVFAGDGQLLQEYAEEHRVYIPIDDIPPLVIDAFLSAEDKRFYEHNGFDFIGIARAAKHNIENFLSGNHGNLHGGSTISQQVAENFLISDARDMEGKIREAIITTRIERTYGKDLILELYLNRILLGGNTYGIAAAALNYFNKSLIEITLPEAAMLAGLPQAPNGYNPIRHPEDALIRRNEVLGMMLRNEVISQEEYETAIATPLVTHPRTTIDTIDADYYVEEVRQNLLNRFGREGLYTSGLSVHTTLQPELQSYAEEALHNGLLAYDSRHGYRGPIAQMQNFENWFEQLELTVMPSGAEGWNRAVVYNIEDNAAMIGIDNGTLGRINLSELEWARSIEIDEDGDYSLGEEITKVEDVLGIGDIILVEILEDQENATEDEASYGLRQIPEINGGVVVMDPHTGSVLAMVGGYAFGQSQFNRATQAYRQPGSSFKPFVYLAGLDAGFTPSSLILDAPFVLEQPDGSKWKPGNYTDRFYGPTPMRIGIERSRNLMTIRLAAYIGMAPIQHYARSFGIMDNMPNQLSMALGAGETTLMRMVTGYSMLVNGGHRISPSLIERVQDRTGQTIYRHDQRDCSACGNIPWQEASFPPPELLDNREQLADPRRIFQVVSMMEGGAQRGTGRTLAQLGIPLGSKSGTTNDNRDAWFIAFSPDLIVGVYTGMDTPRSLGRRETGSRVARPIVQEFLTNALEGEQGIPFRIPEGVRMVRVNATTGELATNRTSNAIWEAFIPGTEPTSGNQQVLGGGTSGESVGFSSNSNNINNYNSGNNRIEINETGSDTTTGTGGIY